MNPKEYLEIILVGYKNDVSGLLSKHLYREWKKAEAAHYALEEFFAGLNVANKQLRGEIEMYKNRRKHEVAVIRNIYESEGRDLKELDGQEDMTYSINVWHITRDERFLGMTLWENDLNYITSHLLETLETVMKEIGSFKYPTFEELFNDVAFFGDLPKEHDRTRQINDQNLHQYQFNNFLFKVCGVKNEDYESYLTREHFKSYIEHKKTYESEYESLTEKFEASDGKKDKWTALTFLLRESIVKGVKILNDSVIETMQITGITRRTLKNKHVQLKERFQEYTHSGKKLSVIEFYKSYNILLVEFKDNPPIYQEVKARLDVLIQGYPEMLD